MESLFSFFCEEFSDGCALTKLIESDSLQFIAAKNKMGLYGVCGARKTLVKWRV
jgi:hypothetical protein